MDQNKVRALLADVKAGRVDVEQAAERLRTMPYDDLDNFARLDVHRGLRQGLPETVFCESKTQEQSAAILARLWEHHDRVLGTRVPQAMADYILAQLPDAHYNTTSRLVTLERTPREPVADDAPYAMVVCGGTSDLPVAEEAAQTVEFAGHPVERAYDVGVAGLHRLLGELDRLLAADVVIAVAGMEGALASVVAGLVASPVVAVPTSVGYGASFGGLAPLLTMLNSCASGVAVVNIDNGYGAAIFAHLVLSRV
jgi:NCAIR mutase (PurE)-related protein